MNCSTRTFLVIAASFLSLIAARVEAADPSLRGIALEDRLEASPLPSDLPPTLPMIARLTLDPTAFAGATAAASLDALLARLDVYHTRNVTVIVAFRGLPPSDADVASWRQILRTVAEGARGKVAAYQIGEFDTAVEPDVNRYVFLLKLAAVLIRSVDSEALVIEGTIPAAALDWERRVFAAGAGPYIDG